MIQRQHKEKQRWLEEQEQLIVRGKSWQSSISQGGSDRKREGQEGGLEGEASGLGTLVNLNMGGWSVRHEEENHMLLYIWILNGEQRGCGIGAWE
jgi:hypothetical protein